MDELQRQMRETAAAVAGEARLPGPAAARRRGRRLRRRARGAGLLVAIVLVVGAVPAAVNLGVLPGLLHAPVIGWLARQFPQQGFGALTLDRYQKLMMPNQRIQGPIEVAASGTAPGGRWRIVAYQAREDGSSQPLVCTTTEYEGDGSDGSDSSCAAASTLLSWNGRATSEAWLVVGWARDAAAVRLRLDDGRMLDAELYPGPKGLPLTFFSAVVRPSADPSGWRAGTLTALDAGGRSLCRRPIDADLPAGHSGPC